MAADPHPEDRPTAFLRRRRDLRPHRRPPTLGQLDRPGDHNRLLPVQCHRADMSGNLADPEQRCDELLQE